MSLKPSMTQGGYAVDLHTAWHRHDFHYLGTVTLPGGRKIGWAWHEDGRSIDRDDRSFDLIFSDDQVEKKAA